MVASITEHVKKGKTVNFPFSLHVIHEWGSVVGSVPLVEARRESPRLLVRPGQGGGPIGNAAMENLWGLLCRD